MIGWIKALFSSRPQQGDRAGPRPTARYDAARWTEENKKHWSWADDRGPRAAVDRNDRRELRRRARYERDNNSYCEGLVQTLAYTFVGKGGPTLQVQTDDQAINLQVENAHNEWVTAIRLAAKLRTMKMAKTVDGECFGLHVTNDKLPTSVKLDLRVLETEQIMTPGVLWPSPTHVDGIDYDTAGNPVAYHVLKNHPGDYGWYSRDVEVITARMMCHWFRANRPGQPRGISEMTAALPLFAFLRRFTLATVSAAETAASIAAYLKTQGPPRTDADYGQHNDEDDFSMLEIVRNMLMMLPAGYDIGQLKSEHPIPAYDEFVCALMREIARCLQIPLTVALLDSSKSNFSSSRLDHMVFRHSIEVERQDCEREVIEPTSMAWYEEAIRVPKLLPLGLPLDFNQLPHSWHWPPWEYLDPLVDRQAITEGLDNGSLTIQQVCARQGDDWRQQITDRLEAEAWEQAERQRLGLSDPAEQSEPAQEEMANAA